MGSRVYGASKLRQKLRKIEPATGKRIGTEVHALSARVVQDAQMMAPVDTGELKASIAYVASRDGLTALIGPGARALQQVVSRTGSAFGRTIKRGKKKGMILELSKRNKKLYMQFLKGYWNEFGTKGGNGHRGTPRRPFMNPAWDKNVLAGRRAVKKALDEALREAMR